MITVKEQQVEGLIVSSTFCALAIFTLIVLLKNKFYRLQDHLFKFIFGLFLIIQISLRCTFVALAVFVDERKLSYFYNNFPAAIFVTLCTMVILQWLKVSSRQPNYTGRHNSKTFYTMLVCYILVNSFLYLCLFVLFGIDVYLKVEHVLIVFSCIYAITWLALVFGILFTMKLTYPWTSDNNNNNGSNYYLPLDSEFDSHRWAPHKRPILGGFITIVICLLARVTFLMIATFVYKDTYNFGYPGDNNDSMKHEGSLSEEQLTLVNGPEDPKIPGFLLVLYYIIGEWIPSLALLSIQCCLPSDLVIHPINSYGELERLIREMKRDTPSEESLDKLLCKICLEREINTALLPCRHSCLCLECANGVQQCPVCRISITQVLQLYRS